MVKCMKIGSHWVWSFLVFLIYFLYKGYSLTYKWNTFFESNDTNTKAIQEAIYHHQNPESCEGKTYVYSLSHNWGHGSSLHMLVTHLGAAMANNRILLLDNNWIWADKKRCNQNKYNLDCYFLPFTKCQNKLNMSDVAQKAKELEMSAWNENKHVEYLSSKHIPHNIHPGFKNIISPDNKEKWWYGQALRYILRPLPQFKKACEHMLEHNLMVLHPHPNITSVKAYPNITGPPDRSIGMFVRHGDKHSETKLHDFSEFMDAAEVFVKKYNVMKHIVLGTDDEHIIDKLEGNYTERRGFTFYYTKFYRKNDNTNHMALGEHVGMYKYTVHAVVNLMIGTLPSLAVFVGGTSSNFDRMMHELLYTDGIHGEIILANVQP